MMQIEKMASKVVANTMNRQPWTAGKRWFPILWVGYRRNHLSLHKSPMLQIWWGHIRQCRPSKKLCILVQHTWTYIYLNAVLCRRAAQVEIVSGCHYAWGSQSKHEENDTRNKAGHKHTHLNLISQSSKTQLNESHLTNINFTCTM
jgi:hypothetical protein